MMCNQANVEVSQQQLAWLQQLELRRTTAGSSAAVRRRRTLLELLWTQLGPNANLESYSVVQDKKNKHANTLWVIGIELYFIVFFCSKMSLHRNIFWRYIYLICVFVLSSGENHHNVGSRTRVNCFLGWQRRKREVTRSQRQRDADQRQVTQKTNHTMKKFRPASWLIRSWVQ